MVGRGADGRVADGDPRGGRGEAGRGSSIPRSGSFVIYQPQPEDLTGDLLMGRAAISLQHSERETPTFGVLWFNARLLTDRDSQHRDHARFRRDQGPAARHHAGRSQSLRVPGRDRGRPVGPLGLPRGTAGGTRVGRKGASQRGRARQRAAAHRGPNERAILLLYDGDPVLEPIVGSKLERIANTPYAVVFDHATQTCYLNGANLWYRASARWARGRRSPSRRPRCGRWCRPTRPPATRSGCTARRGHRHRAHRADLDRWGAEIRPAGWRRAALHHQHRERRGARGQHAGALCADRRALVSAPVHRRPVDVRARRPTAGQLPQGAADSSRGTSWQASPGPKWRTMRWRMPGFRRPARSGGCHGLRGHLRRFPAVRADRGDASQVRGQRGRRGDSRRRALLCVRSGCLVRRRHARAARGRRATRGRSAWTTFRPAAPCTPFATSTSTTGRPASSTSATCRAMSAAIRTTARSSTEPATATNPGTAGTTTHGRARGATTPATIRGRRAGGSGSPTGRLPARRLPLVVGPVPAAPLPAAAMVRPRAFRRPPLAPDGTMMRTRRPSPRRARRHAEQSLPAPAQRDALGPGGEPHAVASHGVPGGGARGRIMCTRVRTAEVYQRDDQGNWKVNENRQWKPTPVPGAGPKRQPKPETPSARPPAQPAPSAPARPEDRPAAKPSLRPARCPGISEREFRGRERAREGARSASALRRPSPRALRRKTRTRRRNQAPSKQTRPKP